MYLVFCAYLRTVLEQLKLLSASNSTGNDKDLCATWAINLITGLHNDSRSTYVFTAEHFIFPPFLEAFLNFLQDLDFERATPELLLVSEPMVLLILLILLRCCTAIPHIGYKNSKSLCTPQIDSIVKYTNYSLSSHPVNQMEFVCYHAGEL